MGLVQYIYTSVLIAELTAENAFETSAMSVRAVSYTHLTLPTTPYV